MNKDVIFTLLVIFLFLESVVFGKMWREWLHIHCNIVFFLDILQIELLVMILLVVFDATAISKFRRIGKGWYLDPIVVSILVI